MKTKAKTTTRISTAMIALALATASFAQNEPPPIPGTYYSAKDPDLPPWPFNPHPELEAVEIEPGIYFLDDTAVPDTPQQAAARAARVAAEEAAAQIDPATAQRLAEETEAARWAWIEREILPWLHTDERFADGTVADDKSRSDVANAKLLALGGELAEKAVEDRREVEEFSRRTGFPTVIHKEDGGVTAIVRIENGIPLANTTQNAAAADTVSTDELWPGGDTGLSLTGTNVNIGIWDGGDVRIYHQERPLKNPRTRRGWNESEKPCTPRPTRSSASWTA